MTTTFRRMRQVALWVAAALVLLLGFVWLALPGIVQSQLQQMVAEKSGHRLTLAKPEINPFKLSVRLRELKLEDPEGKPLLAFRELFVDLAASSLTSRTLIFDQVQLDGLQVSAVLRNGTDGPVNWSRLLAAFASKEAPNPDAPLPRIDIRHLVLTGAQADIADQRTTPPFVSHIDSFDLELNDISTLPDDKGRFRLTAKTAFGAQLEWAGEASLNPLGSSGHIDLRGVDLGKLASLLTPYLPPELGLAPSEGIASLGLDYRLGHAKDKFDLVLESVGVKLAGIALRKPQAAGTPLLAIEAIELQGGRFDLAAQKLEFGAVAVRGTRLEAAPDGRARGNLLAIPELSLAASSIDLNQHNARLGAIELKGGSIVTHRDAKGAIDVVTTLLALAPAASARAVRSPAAAPVTPAAPWRYQIERIGLTGFAMTVHDESVTPAFDLGFDDIAISAQGISDRLETPLPVKVALRVRSGGRLTLDGKVVPSPAAADLQLKLEDLALKPGQAFLGRYAALDLAGGRLAAEGKLVHNAKTSAYRGSVTLNDLRLNEAGTTTHFLTWKSLAARQMEVTTARLNIGELMLDGLDTRLLIAKDKTTNFSRILRQKSDAGSVAAAEDSGSGTVVATSPAPPSIAKAPAAAPAFLVEIDRVRLRNGELDFADQSLLLPFGTRIHRLRGSFAGLSSGPGTHGQLELDGEVDDYGLARAVGQVDIFHPTDFMDIKVTFRNVEMTRLTPYSATFAGRKIDSGKLSLDLEYVIKKRQLQGENKVVIERLVLGERVASPTAKDLPLDLAIALLQDSDGRIDLGLPITGSLDDPQFSYGGLVWKVITNVLTKIVTAPFRALGALFGGGEKLESIAFEAGARHLTPPEREKLVQLAAALNKRPALALTVQGTWNEADRVALQDLQLRRTVLEKSGAKTDAKGDPGPLSTGQPKIQAALEDLFGERFGKPELAALKQGFRNANPGQLEESLTGKMMSRLSGFMSPPRVLSADEVGALKGVDFHALLYQQLRDKEVLPEQQLRQLAQARGEAAVAGLKDARAPGERVILREPEKLEGTAREIPLKLSLGKAGG